MSGLELAAWMLIAALYVFLGSLVVRQRRNNDARWRAERAAVAAHRAEMDS